MIGKTVFMENNNLDSSLGLSQLSRSVAGQVVMITGAASGIGRATAYLFADQGARVGVTDLEQKNVDAVVAAITKAGGQAQGWVLDVTERETIGQVVDKVAAWGGGEEPRLDILVNNAGILRDKTFSKLELENWHAVIDVHLTGSLNATKCVWPIMVEQKYGRIIMTTSTSGLFGNFGQANYGAAKLGLVGFMNTLRFEGAKYNVFTNAIAPIAATRMTVELPGFEDSAEKLAPELVTPAVVYLCSEKAPNGRIIQAAGGRYYSADVRENVGVDLGLGASVEDIEENIEIILDMSSNAGILERTPHR